MEAADCLDFLTTCFKLMHEFLTVSRCCFATSPFARCPYVNLRLVCIVLQQFNVMNAIAF